jgi:hypothetical protein
MKALYNLENNFFQVEDLCGPNLWFETSLDDGNSGELEQQRFYNAC